MQDKWITDEWYGWRDTPRRMWTTEINQLIQAAFIYTEFQRIMEEVWQAMPENRITGMGLSVASRSIAETPVF